MKIVYISNLISDEGSGGGVVSKANLSSLRMTEAVTSVKVINISSLIPAQSLSSLMKKAITFFNNLFMFSGGLDLKRLNFLLNSSDLVDADIIWIDGSTLGRLVKSIKEKYPNKIVITFFHNVEHDFFNSLSKERNWFYKLIVYSSCYNETLTIKFSDFICTLSKADSQRLVGLYDRKADLILPVTFKSVPLIYNKDVRENDKILFVGSDFPPNIEALRFLFREVMPYTNRKLIVVGKGLEGYKKEFSASNIEVVGFVPDVSVFYMDANIVIAPIFSGAGMKVKIAEAFNYGKVVIGTEFSFVGYEKDHQHSSFMIVANNSKEFINNLSYNYESFSLESKMYFEQHLSEKTAVNSLNVFLERLKQLISVC